MPNPQHAYLIQQPSCTIEGLSQLLSHKHFGRVYQLTFLPVNSRQEVQRSSRSLVP